MISLIHCIIKALNYHILIPPPSRKTAPHTPGPDRHPQDIPKENKGYQRKSTGQPRFFFPVDMRGIKTGMPIGYKLSMVPNHQRHNHKAPQDHHRTFPRKTKGYKRMSTSQPHHVHKLITCIYLILVLYFSCSNIKNIQLRGNTNPTNFFQSHNEETLTGTRGNSPVQQY